MSHPHQQNAGAFLKSMACGLATATAGGTGDNTAVTGATIDRQGFGSAQLVVVAKSTLASNETLKVAAEIQDSVLGDGSDWTTAEVLYATTTVDTGAQTAHVTEKRTNIDLSKYSRYVRINFTPNLSASGTDTTVVAATLVLGGPASLPVE